MNNGFDWTGFFRNPFPTIGNAIKKAATPKQPSPEPFYQIKPTDTSLADVSTQVGVPLPQLVAYNQNSKTIPPVGSYISLTPTGNVPSYVQAGNNTYPTGSFLSGSGAANQNTQQTQTPGGYLTNSFTNQAGQVNTAEIVNSIMTSPTMPSSIPDAVLSQLSINGQPVTPQTMTQMGFTRDPNTGIWNQPGAGTQTQQATAKPWEQIVNYNGRLIPAWEAQLREKRANRKARERQMAALAASRLVEGANAGDTESTTLELRLGSG